MALAPRLALLGVPSSSQSFASSPAWSDDVEPDQLGADHRLDIGEGLEHSLAAETRRVAVTQLDRLVHPCARTARNPRLPDAAAVQRDHAFEGRVAARVEDLEGGDRFDSAHFVLSATAELSPQAAEHANSFEVHVECELLIWRVDLVVRQAEADEYGLQPHDPGERLDGRDGSPLPGQGRGRAEHAFHGTRRRQHRGMVDRGHDRPASGPGLGGHGDPGGGSRQHGVTNEFRNCSGSWLGTRRHVILAPALAGMIVFWPGPEYPPQMPLHSRVGRAQSRSRSVHPASPIVAGTSPASARNALTSYGTLANSARSSADGSRTSS